MMSVVVAAVSRLVPLLFYLSFILVAGRWMHDRLASRHRVLGRGAFTALLVIGLAGVTPQVLRATAVVRAELAIVTGDLPGVDRHLRYVHDSGGTVNATMTQEWITALMGMRRWQEAEALLVSGFEIEDGRFSADNRVVTTLGMCRYYQGRFVQARSTLESIPEDPDTYLREYFLGRIAHLQNRASDALAHYNRSLLERPEFFPSVYHLITLHLGAGKSAAANSVLRDYLARVPAAVDSEEVRQLAELIAAGGGAPPAREFFIVFS